MIFGTRTEITKEILDKSMRNIEEYIEEEIGTEIGKELIKKYKPTKYETSIQTVVYEQRIWAIEHDDYKKWVKDIIDILEYNNINSNDTQKIIKILTN